MIHRLKLHLKTPAFPQNKIRSLIYIVTQYCQYLHAGGPYTQMVLSSRSMTKIDLHFLKEEVLVRQLKRVV